MIEEPTEIFKKRAVEVARLFDIADVQEWEQLPECYRRFLVVVEYKVMVVPLVYRDRGNGLSWQALSVKYDLSIKEVRTICQRPYYKAKIGRKNISV